MINVLMLGWHTVHICRQLYKWRLCPIEALQSSLPRIMFSLCSIYSVDICLVNRAKSEITSSDWYKWIKAITIHLIDFTNKKIVDGILHSNGVLLYFLFVQNTQGQVILAKQKGSICYCFSTDRPFFVPQANVMFYLYINLSFFFWKMRSHLDPTKFRIKRT